MSSQGFDTWILEVRGAGLSTRKGESEAIDQSANDRIVAAEMIKSVEKGVTNGFFPTGKSTIASPEDESQLATKLTETLLRLAERVSGFLSEGQSRIMSARFFDQMSKLFEDTQLFERFNEIRRKLSGLLEARQNSAIANQIRDLSQRLVNIVGEGQRSVSPQFFDAQERLYKTIEDFQKQLDLIVQYDWDFDNYLEEDVPAAVR